MAVVKWSTPATESSNLASTLLNSLPANTGNSARIAYDNSGDRALYAKVTIVLGSFNPGASLSVILSVLHRRGADDENTVDDLESYVRTVTSGASAKRIIFPMVRLYPFNMGFIVRNRTAGAFASTGNEFYVQTYGEDVT
jgi:hypothetical protein